MDRRSPKPRDHLLPILWAVIVCVGHDIAGLDRVVPHLVRPAAAQASCQ